MKQSQKNKRTRSKLYKKAHHILHNNVPKMFRSVLAPVTVKKAPRIMTLIPPAKHKNKSALQ